MFDHADRVRQAQARLRELGLDAMIVSPSSDSHWLFDYTTHASERLTAFIIPDRGDVTCVVPRLERARLAGKPGFAHVEVWGETDDPVAVVARLAGLAQRVAVSDQMWAMFLLRIQMAMSQATFFPSADVMVPLRRAKSRAEVDLMREGARTLDEVFDIIVKEPFAGRTEHDISARITELLLARNHSRVDFAIVGSGPNSASPHHAVSDRVIQPGDSVVLDFGGAYKGGISSDITRTVHVGEPSAEYRKVYDTVKRAGEAATAAARAGVPAEQVDAAARAVITEAGYGDYFIHRLGHGIGIDGHEHPYMVSGNAEPLRPGDCFSVEPGIYIPEQFGVRIENIVTIAADGTVDDFNRSTRDLIVVK